MGENGRGMWASPRPTLATPAADFFPPPQAALHREAKKSAPGILRCAAALRVRVARPSAQGSPSRPHGAASAAQGDDDMATIGTFTKSDNGSLVGTVRTL